MRFDNAFLDEIRDRVPISSVIGQRVTWDRKKTNASRGDYWACCPFHAESTPSFHCEDKKGRYHCFGCQVTGDHFRFLTEQEGVSFPEAVERIAGLAGVPMPVRDERAEEREKQRTSLIDVMELATGFFQDQLQSAAGARARAYLRDRGLTPATQQSFRLGYAPESRNALKEFLASKGVEKAQIEACGLVRHGDDIPVSYDYFRDRIMFPIPDSRGRIIAFGGRALSADALAKYMNSPETELFHKGNVLYNYVRARKAIARGGAIIAVEGYMDVIALAQAGFENVVAPLGTALTENQLELLWRMSSEPVLCFDGDAAGLKAAWRAADLALPAIQPGRTARFALLPEGKDPDDLVKAQGAEAFRQVLADARPLADLIWMRETSGRVFDTPERKAELEKSLRELTSRIKDENVRFHYSQEMRERVQTFFGRAKQKPLRRRMGAPGPERPGTATAGRPVRKAGRRGQPFRRVGEPGALGDGQARRRRHAAPGGGDRGGAGQPSPAHRREFRARRIPRIVASRPSRPACDDPGCDGPRCGQRPQRSAGAHRCGGTDGKLGARGLPDSEGAPVAGAGGRRHRRRKGSLCPGAALAPQRRHST
jgi:DNA primase